MNTQSLLVRDEVSRSINRRQAWRLPVLLAILLLLTVLLILKRASDSRAAELALQLKQGLRAAREGDYPLAAKLLDTYIRSDPDHAEALLARGRVALAMNDGTLAESCWNRIPNSPGRTFCEARCEQGRLLMETGQSRRAEEQLLKSVELDISYLPSHETLCALYARQLRRDDMRRELETIRRLRLWSLEDLVVEAQVSRRRFPSQEGIDRMRRFLANDHGDLFSTAALAQYLMNENQLSEASDLLRDSLRREPHANTLRGLLAEIHLRHRDIIEAARVLHEAYAPASTDTPLWRSLGEYWVIKKEWPKAAECLRHTVQLDAEDADIHQELAEVLRRLERHQEAEQYLQRSRLLQRLSELCSQLGSRTNEDQAHLLAQVLEVANLHVQLGRPLQAFDWFEQAWSLDHHSKEALDGITMTNRLFRQSGRKTDSELISVSLPELPFAQILPALP